MGINSSKLKCLYLPAQSGKTRKVEELIERYKDMNEEFGDSDVNIFISANNLLLVKQSEGRFDATFNSDGPNQVDNDIDDGERITERIFSWVSSDKKSNISASELALNLVCDNLDMIILCAHPTRLKYLSQMLEKLNTLYQHNKFTSKVNIWIDEADVSINIWSKYAELMSMNIVEQVTLVSATFDSVFAKYNKLQVIGYKDPHPECYRGLKDSVMIEENFATNSTVEYVKHVIHENKDKLVQPGIRAFIPGQVTQESHNAIADLLHKEYGFVVIIINGARKEILVPGEDPIDLRSYLSVDKGNVPEQFNTLLAKLYTSNNWSRFPLAITGFYCVSRGVTFQCGPEHGVHDGFLFDYGILPPISKKSEAYQTMARLFGNIGHLSTYKPVDIYSCTAMFNKVKKQEAMVMNLARMVYEQGLESVDKSDLKAAQNFDTDKVWDLKEGEFNNLKDANKFMRLHGANGKTEKSLEKNKKGDFYLSSLTKSKEVLLYSKIKDEMSRWCKTSSLDVERKSGDTYGRMYICYKDLQDPSSIVFMCRVVRRK